MEIKSKTHIDYTVSLNQTETDLLISEINKLDKHSFTMLATLYSALRMERNDRH